jgi:hypothetical protein
MQYAVKDLDGVLLNAAVAKAMDDPRVSVVVALNGYIYASIADGLGGGQGSTERPFLPSTDWRDGGPIIEREQIMLISAGADEWDARIGEVLHALSGDPVPDGSGRSGSGWGETALIAAMRAFCASKFGETVELP